MKLLHLTTFPFFRSTFISRNLTRIAKLILPVAEISFNENSTKLGSSKSDSDSLQIQPQIKITRIIKFEGYHRADTHKGNRCRGHGMK